MLPDDNKKLVRRFYEEAPGDPDICDEIFNPVIRWRPIQHTSVSTVMETTPAMEKGIYQELDSTWGDWHNNIDEMIADGNRVMVRWTFSGTHQGEFFGLQATGKKISYSGINIFCIENGRIAEVWDIYDRLWMWQQLGVLPQVKEAIAALLNHLGYRDER